MSVVDTLEHRLQFPAESNHAAISRNVSRRGSQEWIAGVAARLLGTSLTTFTDRGSQFKIENVAANTYQLAFSCFRYGAQIINVTVEAN